MHSYLAWETQPLVYTHYTLFVAEVASNFHQALVRAHLLETVDRPRLQLAVIEEAMANFHRYLFVMPTLARFEREIHERVERGEGVTADQLDELMADLFAEGFGPDVALDRERMGITWAQFGHLYAPFYVYQYATGIAGAHALARASSPARRALPSATWSSSRPAARSTRSTRSAGPGSTSPLPQPVEAPSACSPRSSTSSKRSHSPWTPPIFSGPGRGWRPFLPRARCTSGFGATRTCPSTHVGTGALVLDERFGELLADVHRGYLRIGRDADLPMLLQTDTWRATGARIDASGWRGIDLNRANAELMSGVADEGRAAGGLCVGGLLGPAGDGYAPAVALGRDDARARTRRRPSAGRRGSTSSSAPRFPRCRRRSGSPTPWVRRDFPTWSASSSGRRGSCSTARPSTMPSP